MREGVHINSGIPNRAFYLAATAFGGDPWDRAGKIWYDTVCKNENGLRKRATFKQFAEITCKVAQELYDLDVRNKVREAWKTVGVL